MFYLFPEHYDLKNLKGPRAQQFDKREDAFQQLVGDALKEMGGHGVYVSPTKNQDGSIDIYLDSEFSLIEPFKDLEFPIIVECKDHDDQLSHLVQNIEKGWGKVKQKLDKHAEQGWKKLFLPWQRAKSYVYCISSLINTQTRIDLQNNIQTFFDNLPDHHRPPFHKIRVLHWDDLRHWLNQLPRVVDEWLGIYLENVLNLKKYLSRLSGVKQYLKKSELEFVAPLLDNPCHPNQIMKRLNQTIDKPGILIDGAGGVGKTRTMLEVSQIAEEQGWRVLFVLPNEPLVTVERLAEVILPYKNKTLLVFDYLDQMQNLDLGMLHRSFFPQAKERGVRLALLANSRPKWMMSTDPERDALFDRLELVPTRTQKVQIITELVEKIAPRAIRILGRDQIFHLCGLRPIIALLIARELENRVYEDQLELGNIKNLRTGDLIYWLQRRLKEDDIYVEPPESILIPSRPKPYVVGACVALACAPNLKTELIFATESLLRNLEYEYPNHARSIIQSLTALGWLESEGRLLYSAHDVVTDEVLDQVIFEKESIHGKELEAILSCSLKRLQFLSRFVTALNRLIGSKGKSAVKKLKKASKNWLMQNAYALGQLAKETDTEDASFSLGSVVAGPPWNEVVIQTWEDFIAPWLEIHKQEQVARHLLYKGLKNIDETETSIVLIRTSIEWLQENAEYISASFVLNALLARTDLVGDEAKKSKELAFLWLEIYLGTLDSQFVVRPLLLRRDLGNDEAKKSIDLALSWLDKYYETLEAEFVLNALLLRRDLGNDEAKKSIDLALSWLDKHFETLEAKFVLDALLSRSDLGSDEAKKSIDLALSWLDKHHETLESQFVLKPLLARIDMVGDEAKKSIDQALLWLGKHYETLEAEFVLNALLLRSDLGSEEAKKSIDLALSWLDKHYETLEAEFVLNALLLRSDLGNEEAKKSIDIALSWLDKHHETLESQFVVRPLLLRSDLRNEEAKKSIDIALSWLDKHYETLEAEFIFNALLLRSDLGNEEAKKSKELALSWLDKHYETLEAEFVLHALLSRSDLVGEKAKKSKELAFSWLDINSETEKAQFVLKALLSRNDLVDNEAKKSKELAFSWLSIHHETLESQFVVRPLLLRSDLENDEAKKSKELALLWLNKHFEMLDAQFVLNALLSRIDLVGEEAKKSKELALSWLDKHFETIEAKFVFKALLSRNDLVGDEAKKSKKLAFSWLEIYLGTLDSQFVVRPLLLRSDLGNDEAKKSIDLALLWLDKHFDMQKVQFVLDALLSRSDLGSQEAKKSKKLAFSWLDINSETQEAQFMLKPLLERIDLVGEEAKKSKELALSWLDKHHETGDALFVLKPLLARSDLGSDEAKKSKELSISWLDKHYETRASGFIFPLLLSRADLGKHDEAVIQFAMDWLERKDFYLSTDAEFVLKHLLQKDHLPEIQKKRLVHVSLERIKSDLKNDEATFLIRACLRCRLNDENLIENLFDVAIQWLSVHSSHSEKDYVFNKLLRRPRLANHDWTRVAKIALDWLKSVPKNHPQRDYAISSLHRRSVSLISSTDFEYLLEETTKWLKEHKETDAGFLGLIRSLITIHRKMNKDHPSYLEISELIENNSDRFDHYRLLLNDYIGKTEESVDIEIVRRSLSEFKKRSVVSPASAGYMIPALMAIALQLETELGDEIYKTVQVTVNDQRYKESQKGGMLRECQKIMKKEGFLQKEKALRFLFGVGLESGDVNSNT